MTRFLPLLLLIAASASAAFDRRDCKPTPCPPEKTWPKLKNCRDSNIFGFGEYIYWRYSSPNLAFGRDGVGLTNAVPVVEVPVHKPGQAYYPDFHYNSGFKAGIGSHFGEKKAWDIVAIYTWLYSNPSRTVTGFNTSFEPLNFMTSASLAENTYSLASMRMNLHFQWGELQSGYTFSPNRFLSLRPYIALQAIVVEGDLFAQYNYTTPAAAGGISEINKTHGHCSSWSIGPRVGLDYIVHMCDTWGIYSNVSWTQQATSLHMKTKEVEELPASGTSFIIQNGRLTAHHNVGIFSLELGPTVDMWFSNDAYRLQIRGTWSVGTLPTGANLSFLNNNNQDIVVGSEFRGFNVRATLEF